MTTVVPNYSLSVRIEQAIARGLDDHQITSQLGCTTSRVRGARAYLDEITSDEATARIVSAEYRRLRLAGVNERSSSILCKRAGLT